MNRLLQYFEAIGTIILYLLKIGGQKIEATTRRARETAAAMLGVLKVLAVITVVVPPIVLLIGLVTRNYEVLAAAGCLFSFGAFVLLYLSNQFSELFEAINLPPGGVGGRLTAVGALWVKLLQGYLLALTSIALYTIVLQVFDQPMLMMIVFIALMGMSVIAMREKKLGRIFAVVVYSFVILLFVACTGFLAAQAFSKAAKNPNNPIGAAIQAKLNADRAQATKDSLAAIARANPTREQARLDAIAKAKDERDPRLTRGRERHGRQTVYPPAPRTDPGIQVPLANNSGETYVPPTNVSPAVTPDQPISPGDEPKLSQVGMDGGWFDVQRSTFIPASRPDARFRLSTKCAVNWSATYIIYEHRRRYCGQDGEFVIPNLHDGQDHGIIIHLVCDSSSGD